MHPTLTKPSQTSRLAAMVAIMCAVGATAHAAVVTPSTLGNWSPAPFGGGVTAITTAFPSNGLGSIEITLPSDSAGVDWEYQLATPVELNTFTSGAYDYWRDSANSSSIWFQVPSYGLLIDHACDGATKSYLVYEPYYQSNPPPSSFPTNQWITESVMPASIVWESGQSANNNWSSQPLSNYMNGTATGPVQESGINGNSCITALVPFAGSGWVGNSTPVFHGAIDNVRMSAGGAEVVNANFEPYAPAAPTAVPTLSQWGLGLTALLLGALGLRRTRRATSKA